MLYLRKQYTTDNRKAISRIKCYKARYRNELGQKAAGKRFSNQREVLRFHDYCKRENPGGLSPATPNARSSATPTRAIVPSSKSRPISVMPYGTRRGWEKAGRG